MAINTLIVDDSTTVRAVLAKTLRLAGVPVGDLHQAGNGKEALAILQDAWVDLIFTDINMPEMNGIELIEALSKDGLMESVPVIVVSTEGSTTRIEEVKAKGVRAYLRKPFTPESVREVVEDILGPMEGSA